MEGQTISHYRIGSQLGAGAWIRSFCAALCSTAHVVPILAAVIVTVLFESLGTSSADKRHAVYDAGRFPLPRNLWIPEAIQWLEKYK